MGYVNLQTLAFEAFAHIEKKEFSQAETKLSYLLNVNPEEPILLYYLGCLFLDEKRYGWSIMAYERALHFRPEFDECLNNISTAYRQVGRLDKSIEYFQRAIEIARRPEYLQKCDNDAARAKKNLADYLGNLGSCYVAKGTPKTALKYLNESLEILPNTQNAMWNAGLAYLELGDYEKGFYCYDFGDRIGESKERSYHGGPNSTPVWPGPGTKKENGELPTVVVYGEQGIGDEIMFASIVPDLMKDANVIFECHPRLMEMFRLKWPEIPIFGTRKAREVNWAKNYKIDYKIAIGSLAKHYRKKKEDFPGAPYLIADPKRIDKMRRKLDDLGPRKKIGISWKGGIGITNKGPRCIDLEVLKPLFAIDADFISLQYHNNAQHEVDVFNEQMGATVIHHWQPVVDDYDLTAALLPCLDMVISVPQSVIHLAGALGVNAIQLCPVQALWQMGPYGENAPWYNCVQNFWQLIDGSWVEPINNVINLLEYEGYKRC